VSFISNRDFQSSSGGALDVAFSCTATLTGRSTFTNNQANPSGAALRVNDGGRVVIQGPVCSSGNDVFGNGLQNVGKFAQVFGTLELNAPTETMIIREGLSAISVESGSRVQCGSNATTWAAPAPGPNGNIQYAINGEACGCDADFIAGNSTTCNTCDNDPSTCNCKASGGGSPLVVVCVCVGGGGGVCQQRLVARHRHAAALWGGERVAASNLFQRSVAADRLTVSSRRSPLVN